MELPLYQCHKKVRAARILAMSNPDERGNVELRLDYNAKSMRAVLVDAAWMIRNPKTAPGGYFVQYLDGDGYTAYFPAALFEAGYTRISGPEPVSGDFTSESVSRCSGMYGESPRVQIGSISLSRQGADHIWVEKENGEGFETNTSTLEAVLKDFYAEEF